MPIAQGYKDNFSTLMRAVKNNDVVLMECTDASTGQSVMTVCAVFQQGEEYVTVPLAKLFDGNPYEELKPPELSPPEDAAI